MTESSSHLPKPPKGEAQVWLTAMGLAVGILMIVFLLGLILVRGVEVFWPKRVIQFELKEGAASAPNGNLVIAGEVAQRQDNVTTGHEEILLHMGNKSQEQPGTSFRYIDTTDIINQSTPEGLLAAERTEFGDAFFYPLSLTLSNGTTVAASEKGFRDTLDAVIEEGEERRHELLKLEKKDIGSINSDLAEQNLIIKSAERDTNASEQERSAIVSKANARIAELQEDYRVLADRAQSLRQALTQDVLAVRLPTGEERQQPIGEIIRLYAPNAIGFWERLGLFFAQGYAFLVEDPREANTEGGIFPAIFGTFAMTILMSILVTPFGVIAAIYLREYARQGFLVRSVRISVNNLAGVPSIVFGVFGLGFFVYFLGHNIDKAFFSASLPTPTFGTGGILWASLTLALLTLPVVIVATEEALASVPRGVREAALACGASKWQTIQRVVLPASAPGVLTGVILAMARGAGEVAPLMLVGVVKLAPSLPIDTEAPFIHADRKFMHLGFHIYDVGFQSPDSEAARPMVFATTLLLITLVIAMNLAAILLRNRLRKKYASGTF